MSKNSLKQIKSEIRKTKTKRALLLAGLASGYVLIIGGVSYGTNKVLNIHPFDHTYTNELIETDEIDNKGNHIVLDTEYNKVPDEVDELTEKTIFKIYDKWEQSPDYSYYRLIHTYSADIDKQVDYLLKKDISELNENDLVNLGFKIEGTIKETALSLSEDELNKEPFIKMITNKYGVPVEHEQTIGENLLYDVLPGGVCDFFVCIIPVLLYALAARAINEKIGEKLENKECLLEEKYNEEQKKLTRTRKKIDIQNF